MKSRFRFRNQTFVEERLTVISAIIDVATAAKQSLVGMKNVLA